MKIETKWGVGDILEFRREGMQSSMAGKVYMVCIAEDGVAYWVKYIYRTRVVREVVLESEVIGLMPEQR